MEEWRAVSINPDYEVSSEGRIRRVAHGKSGRGRLGLLPGSTCTSGYRLVELRLDGKFQVMLGLHVLVATAFHGPRPSPEHEVAHWDGDERNNRKTNLRWATRKENAEDRIRHGMQSHGELHGLAKLTDDQVIQAHWDYWVEAISQQEIADGLGVCKGVIGCIINGKAWAHLYAVARARIDPGQCRRLTACRNGHPLSGPYALSRTKRGACTQCNREYRVKFYAAHGGRAAYRRTHG